MYTVIEIIKLTYYSFIIEKCLSYSKENKKKKNTIKKCTLQDDNNTQQI